MAYINGKEVLFYPQAVATSADVEIVQELGTSETAVMSQKAVTEALEKIEVGGVEIVQERGSSETAVMSQKVVTEELNESSMRELKMITAINELYKVATSIDLSAYESNGQIVETYEDGSTKTTTVEFDAIGNPIKITDANGNVTVLTW